MTVNIDFVTKDVSKASRRFSARIDECDQEILDLRQDSSVKF
jgi:hypothetical protein